MTRKDGKPRSLPTTLGLDPLPMIDPFSGQRFRLADESLGYRLFPRPGYSQNPADYAHN